MTIIVSEHAYQRAKQRLGLKGKAVQRRVERAWHEGVAQWEADGTLAAWMNAKMRRHPHVSGVRIYNGFAYFFADTTCTTIIAMPKTIEDEP